MSSTKYIKTEYQKRQADDELALIKVSDDSKQQ